MVGMESLANTVISTPRSWGGSLLIIGMESLANTVIPTVIDDYSLIDL
jgi:hypothetical protein